MATTRNSAKAKGKAIATSSGTGDQGANKRPREASTQPRGRTSTRRDPVKEALDRCVVHATRFIDWDTMDTIGIKDDLEMLFTAMGINRYMHSREYTHVDETLQFFETLAPGDDDDDDSFVGIRFQIDGKSYRVTIGQLRDIYGFERIRMRIADMSNQEGMMDMWHYLASGSYRMGKSKSSWIRNPVIKIAQRALGFTFFGRSEVGTVTAEEWRMICHALRPLVASFDPPVRFIPTVDPAHIFMGNLSRMQDLASRKKPDEWPLCIGGTLTPLFRYLRVPLGDPISDSIPLIDTQHLRRCYFFARSRPNDFAYPFTWNGVDHELVLPAPELVSISIPQNLLFHHFLGDNVQEDEGDMGGNDEVAPGEERMPEEHIYGDARYLRPIHGVPRTPMERELVEQVKAMQRWNKWQSRSIKKLVDSVRTLKIRTRRLGYPSSSSSDHDTDASPESSNPSVDVTTPAYSEEDEESGSA